MVIRMNIVYTCKLLCAKNTRTLHTEAYIVVHRALLSVFICYFYVPFVCNYCLYYVVTAIACVLLLDHIVPNYVDVKLVSTSLSKVLHGVGLHQFSLRNLHKLQRLVMI
jgi:hypothetical protein